MQINSVETRIHGRFLHVPRDPRRLVIGFHGYGETAEVHLAELERIPGIEQWSLVSVQALHPFYTRTGSIVASWMTSLDRDHAIADNLSYISSVVAAVPQPEILVYSGFSQGATMAARATQIGSPVGLMLLGGDIPPEIRTDSSLRLPRTLLGRGERDDWYTPEKFKQDLNYLESSTNVVVCEFEGGHEWSEAFRAAAGTFLDSFVEG
jgi:predicted esterase